MREYKFRAWDRKLNAIFPVQLLEFAKMDNSLSWISGVDIHHGLSDSDGDIYYGGSAHKLTGTPPLPRFELMQFTGLHDKNGVDIYEGDIVRAHSMAIEDNPSNNVVKFENGSFRYNCEPKADVPCGCYKSSEVEVIGNIHDNPELMEVRP